MSSVSGRIVEKPARMKIALLGTRGIPACYSGFETFYEELSWRLVQRGHEVTVYNRSNYISYREPTYRGVRLVRLPTISNKHFDTIVHTFFSVLHSLLQGFDIVYFCIVGNSPLTIIPRLFGCQTLLNVDGADWEREKWGGMAKAYLRWAERIACKFPDIVITDSEAAKKRYQKLYNKETTFIPYGANFSRTAEDSYLKEFGLEKNRYILFVGRLEPENQAHLLIEVFRKIETDLKLVIVGDAPYGERYKQELRRLAGDDSRIVFTGFVFGEGYRQLSSHAYLFVLTSGVEGTRPVLLDQMAFENCVLVRNSDANMEVIGQAGFFFDQHREEEDLKKKLEFLIAHPEIVEALRGEAKKRIQEKFSWERIADQYEELFGKMIGNTPA